MCNKLIIYLFLVVFCSFNLIGQSKFSLSVSSGFNFYNLAKKKKDFSEVINGYGTQHSLGLWYEIEKGKLKVPVGIGFSRLDYLDNNLYFGSNRENRNRNLNAASYITLNGGLSYYLRENKKLALNANLSTYILAHYNLLVPAENRIFANLDIGCSIKVSGKSELFILTPFTFLPIYSEDLYLIFSGGGGAQFKSFVKMNGVSIGFKFRL